MLSQKSPSISTIASRCFKFALLMPVLLCLISLFGGFLHDSVSASPDVASVNLLIRNIRKGYTNLSKLNANYKKDVDVIKMHVWEITRNIARSLGEHPLVFHHAFASSPERTITKWK